MHATLQLGCPTSECNVSAGSCHPQVILFAFASYFIADGQNQSGIVSVLFCGMVSPS